MTSIKSDIEFANRQVALNEARLWCESNTGQGVATTNVVETAEAFYKFLMNSDK